MPDTLLLLEHHPVYTRGRRTQPTELPMGEQWYGMQGIEVAETDRGGAVTYHGPGQLVAYPIVDLGSWGDDVHAYVRRLEQVMIGALADHDVPAQVFDGLTGVWTAGEPPIEVGARRPAGDAGRTRLGPGRAGRPGAQDRLDRDPREQGCDDARARGQRRQRPTAVRVDRPLRDRVRADDLPVARARRRAEHGTSSARRSPGISPRSSSSSRPTSRRTTGPRLSATAPS